MYHCPDCGNMVLAGMEHPDWGASDNAGRMSDETFSEYERYTSAESGDLDEIMDELRRARASEASLAARVTELEAAIAKAGEIPEENMRNSNYGKRNWIGYNRARKAFRAALGIKETT